MAANSVNQQTSGQKNLTQHKLIPPLNFASVCKGIYRSGYPVSMNFPFLRQKRLKSILCLCPEILKSSTQEFAEQNGINIHCIQLTEAKEPFIGISNEAVANALQILIDTNNHPILIHCERGKFSTGVVCACLRRLQRWALTAAFAEYRRFAGIRGSEDNPRMLDLQFIELFTFPSSSVPTSSFLLKKYEAEIKMQIEKNCMNSKTQDFGCVDYMTQDSGGLDTVDNEDGFCEEKENEPFEEIEPECELTTCTEV